MVRRALVLLAAGALLGVWVGDVGAGAAARHGRSRPYAKVITSRLYGVPAFRRPGVFTLPTTGTSPAAPTPTVPTTTVPTTTVPTTTVPTDTTTTTTTTPPPLPSRTGVAEAEYRVHAAHNPVATGSVELDVSNNGMDAHDLTVADADGHILGQTAEIVAGGEATLNVTLAPGTYKLYCSLYDGEHDQLGMHVQLTVQ